MFFIKTYRLSFFIYIISSSLFSFSQKNTDANKLDQLFVKWSTSKYHNPNNVLHLACQPIDTVRIAVIGLGNRGQMALERLPKIEGVKIIAIADIDSNKVNESADKFFKDYPYSIPDKYYGSNDWEIICQRKDIDLIYICTHWELHTPIAVFAMENDKHVAYIIILK